MPAKPIVYKSKRSKVYSKPTATVSSVVRKEMKKEIQKAAEKKVSNYTKTSFICAYNNIIERANCFIPMTPYPAIGVDIQVGASSGDRVGNSIRVSKATFSFILFPVEYGGNNPSPKPQEVRMWFFSDRSNNYDPPFTLTDFFQNGGSSAAPASDLTDLMRSVNKDAYIYRGMKTYKVGQAMFDGAANSANHQYYANNDFKYNQRHVIDITDMVPKVIKYDDNTTIPTNTAVWCYIETLNADGSVLGTSSTPIKISYEVLYSYTDL